MTQKNIITRAIRMLDLLDLFKKDDELYNFNLTKNKIKNMLKNAMEVKDV